MLTAVIGCPHRGAGGVDPAYIVAGFASGLFTFIAVSVVLRWLDRDHGE
jgi:hypothetical protein